MAARRAALAFAEVELSQQGRLAQPALWRLLTQQQQKVAALGERLLSGPNILIVLHLPKRVRDTVKGEGVGPGY